MIFRDGEYLSVVAGKIDYPNKREMPLRLLNYLINNSYYCWENYARCKDHLESAKCIGGLSATSPLIPLKLYLPVLPAFPPPFFKQPWITSCKTPRKIYDATHKVVGRLQATCRVLFVTRRSGHNLSERRWISGATPTRSPNRRS